MPGAALWPLAALTSPKADIVPLEIVEKLIYKYKCTKLILDYNALPLIYDDKHCHLQLPNKKIYGGKY